MSQPWFVIQANSESLRDVSHDEAIRVLKASPNLLDLLVEPAQLEFSVRTTSVIIISFYIYLYYYDISNGIPYRFQCCSDAACEMRCTVAEKFLFVSYILCIMMITLNYQVTVRDPLYKFRIKRHSLNWSIYIN